MTTGGVVEYSRRSVWRLVSTAFLAVTLAAGSMSWLAHSRWVPVINTATETAPEKARISAGRLKWPADAARRLAETDFLAIIADPRGSTVSGQSSDLQVELGENELRLRSLFGYFPVKYDVNWDVTLDRPVIVPLWQAWRVAFQGLIAGAAALWILISWAGLGLVYGSGFWLTMKLAARRVTLWGSIKLAVASLMAPAVWMSVSILAYALGTISLGGLLVAFALHVIIPWFFLVLAPFKLEKLPPPTEELFGSKLEPAVEKSSTKPPSTKRGKSNSSKKENPFAGQ